MKSDACTEEALLISLISSPPRLFIVFQSGPDAGGGCHSFNPFHLGFHPNILAGPKLRSLPHIVIIINHYHNPSWLHASAA